MTDQKGWGWAVQEALNQGESAFEGGVEGKGFFVADFEVEGQGDDRGGGVGADGGAGEDQGRTRKDGGEEAGQVLALGTAAVGEGAVFVAPGSGVPLGLAVTEDEELHGGKAMGATRGGRGGIG